MLFCEVRSVELQGKTASINRWQTKASYVIQLPCLGTQTEVHHLVSSIQVVQEDMINLSLL